MRILITGSTGLVGTALTPHLAGLGHDVWRLVRSAPAADHEIRWDPASASIDDAALDGFDAVVHLAGESIGEGRWTADKKARIRSSRIDGTRLLSATLARLARRPGVLVSASAVGWYGDRRDEVLTESSAPGTGFLAGVCRDWEAAADPARDAGIRVVHPRFGVILSARGGALAKMLPPFRMGAGGRIGNGRQWVSWVALDDVVDAIGHALGSPAVSGPVNVTSPQPVTNEELTRTLGAVLHRPAAVPVPAFAARLAFGEMADALLLASARVLPARLDEHGFRFRFPALEGALHHVLDEPGPDA